MRFRGKGQRFIPAESLISAGIDRNGPKLGGRFPVYSPVRDIPAIPAGTERY